MNLLSLEKETWYKETKIMTVRNLYEFQTISKNFFDKRFREENEYDYGMRKRYNFNVPNTFNKYGERTKRCIVPKLLNKLSDDLIEEQSKYLIKRKLKEWIVKKTILN